MKTLILALATTALCAFAHAQQPHSQASVDEIVQSLSPAPKTRSLGRNLKVEPAKIDLTIGFDFDSDRIMDGSKAQLGTLAKALNHERLVALRFQVEGHTDAQGRADYNLALSGRRADAVLAYLVEQGVGRERLQAVGKGYSELLVPQEPRAAKNRRVRITTLE